MIALMEQHRDRLLDLCRRHHVARLELFGSALGDAFDPARSDLDFLVDFQPLQPRELADEYFGLLFDLEDLFGRKIDLVMSRALHNPYFRRGIDRTRQLLYAA